MRNSRVLLLAGISILLLTGCSEKAEEIVSHGTEVVDDVVKTGTEAMDKVQEVDAEVTNVMSSLSVRVQLLQELEYEYNEEKFTLEEVFNAVLEDPKREADEIEGVQVVNVTGGLKEDVLNNRQDEYEHEEIITEVFNEAARVTFVFPFYDNQFLPDSEIGVIYKIGGERITGGMGEEILLGLLELYYQETDNQ